MPSQLRRLAKRASIGIGRNGTPGGNNSGDIFLAISTANDRTRQASMTPIQNMEFIADEGCDAFYLAAVEAIEEAVVNALVAAEDMATFKPSGRLCKAIDHTELARLFRKVSALNEFMT
ncbi:P1 family peptidase [Dongia rigui]|uniref:P1 family peptidase n=1 Tax=Dongia rigui TaxID=940149 RepID=A0ABU5DTU1_9PROT|nr:P1 family peptidase [Dongia rigui]MDY0870741.1 P1 family peptidase [Dongia rigui]